MTTTPDAAWPDELRQLAERLPYGPQNAVMWALDRIAALEAENTRLRDESRRNIDAHKTLIQAMLHEAVGDADIDTDEQAVAAIRRLRAWADAGPGLVQACRLTVGAVEAFAEKHGWSQLSDGIIESHVKAKEALAAAPREGR